ncbi:hypothetical protein RA307_25690 [Xanthobacteraceae bacterium Astr-EGSB]|uniref:hypothetical protein n=1 Tax=Astrobacterium formosum TaxID=3069710 RepID=UPI0027B31D1E|nr:hypothetical protein [Xanthobacteraceae bacterium Astr-EGSB]
MASPSGTAAAARAAWSLHDRCTDEICKARARRQGAEIERIFVPAASFAMQAAATTRQIAADMRHRHDGLGT